MMKGQKLWNKAKRIIPGGNQLLSKRAELFLPDYWPAYYKKAKGCEVWDLDGNHYYDFSHMGVGACILGYADDDVNAAVFNAIKDGNMCTLNCYEEVQLAEKLIELHQWAEMVRFAKTGGEACAIAIRIGRALTGKSKIAFCGYHGWHDWYLSANLQNSKHLDQQLLPGLHPSGVPKELHSTVFPFSYNNLKELEIIFDQNHGDIGVIIMEPRRSKEPEIGFLEGVRDIADKNNAVLVFDEITSGFRLNNGGIHLIYGVDPDLAILGKALGNGYPIAAVIGKKSVMEAAQNTFISSTMWTERIGFVAALETLKKIEKEKVQDKMIHFGESINKGWKKISEKRNVDIEINGIPPLTHITFQCSEPLAAKTLYTQEMLNKGYLVGNCVYTCFAYSDQLIDQFINHSDEAFTLIKKAYDSGQMASFIKGEIAHSGFKRLT